MSTRKSSTLRWWIAGLALALALPWFFFDWTTQRHSGFALTMFSEIGLVIVFALSFNMQMGQAGLLSFGHAILFGLGGYCTAHALDAIKAAGVWFPMELVPLAGGLGGLGFGVVFGYIATKQRATAFAGSWATRRGLDPMKPWTIPNVLGIAGRQQLGKRMIGRFARNLGTVIPFLVGAVIGASVNSTETKKLAVEMRADLRRVQAERLFPGS